MREVTIVPKPKGRWTVRDAKPIVENPVPEPLVTVKQLVGVTNQLGAAVGAMKTATRPIAADLAQEEDRLRLYARQQQPLWEAQCIATVTEQAIEAIDGFVTAVTQARAIIDELGPALDAASERLAADRAEASNIHLLERLDLYAADLAKARRAWGDLRRPTEEYEAWVPTARVSAGRIARAAARVSREYLVAGLTGRLKALAIQRENIRSAPMPADDKIRVAVARAEALVKKALPVPQIAWPASNDPFAGPELQEP